LGVVSAGFLVVPAIVESSSLVRLVECVRLVFD
jgi:hypothetical protein